MDQSYPKESWKICNTMLYNGLEFLDQSYPRKIGKFVRIFRVHSGSELSQGELENL